MNTEVTEPIDFEVSDDASPAHQPAESSALPSNHQFRTSRYSTGVLTTSGWVPLTNTNWKVIRSEVLQEREAAETEVDDLLKNQEVCSRSSARSKAPSDSGNDEIRDECDDESTAGVPEEYLEYGSYFRHAGWRGCASLHRSHDTSNTAATVLQQQINVQSQAAAKVKITDKIVTPVTSEDQSEQSKTAGPANKATAAGLNEMVVVLKEPPVQQVKPGKQIKAFFHPEEDAWLLLFHSKIKVAAEAGHNIKLPGPSAVLVAFNAFFEGRVLKDERGRDLPSRQAREENSMKGKITKTRSKIWLLRDVTRKLLEGKKGGTVFVPAITEEELKQYQISGGVSL